MPIVRTTRPVGARSVHVIDGALEDSFVATFAAWAERLNYGRSDYDVAGMEEYLHFKHEIGLDQLTSNPLCRVLGTQVVAEVERAYGSFAPQLTRAYVDLAASSSGDDSYAGLVERGLRDHEMRRPSPPA